MKITWYGLACFYLEGSRARILMDPFDDTCGYPVPYLEAELWTYSHSHYDHDHRASVLGENVPEPVDGLDTGHARLKAVKTWHDGQKGALWGENTVWIVETDGLRIAHLGDLGHVLEKEHLEQMGNIDILLVPTGGCTYSLDERQAAQVTETVNARLTIPMHYRTHHLRGFELNEGIAEYLPLINRRVIHTGGNVLEITPELLSEPTVAVLTLA